jgi:two-component system sensor histidine kinase UhpB
VEVDFEFIVEAAPDAVLIVSAAGRILRINAEAERMFGYPRRELTGQLLEILLPARLRDTHVMCREQYAYDPALRPMGSPGCSLAIHRDGREFSVDVSLSPMADGTVIAIVRDVSDRERIDQELRELAATLERRVAELARQTRILESILNSMGEGVIVYGQAGKLLLENPAALRLHPALQSLREPLDWATVVGELGLFRADKLTPYPAEELPLARVIKGEDVDGLEVYVRPPGAPEGFWTTVTGRPLRDDNGNIVGGVVVIRDTTATKFAQGALLAGQEAEGKRIARELHDSVAQDLCSLILELAQLQQSLPGSLGDRIGSQKTKLIELSGQLDCVCRQLHPSVLERIGLIQAVEQLCLEYSERKGLRAQFTHDGNPPSVSIDTALCVYRVAQEGLRNVLRHAQTKRATVGLSAAHGALHLCIEDDGVGFDPKTVGGKARLGLVSMQERVRLAGGSLSVYSAPGKGTRIDLRVPLLEEPLRPEADHKMTSGVAAS